MATAPTAASEAVRTAGAEWVRRQLSGSPRSCRQRGTFRIASQVARQDHHGRDS
ncbi:MAG: hypothetical protein ACR2MP_30410 [Streptosporangiaceae bacterium]